MKIHRRHILLLATMSAGSFLFMLLLAILTSPVRTVAYAIAFFVTLLIFLISLGYLVVYLQAGQMRLKDRYRIFIISFFILVTTMLRSAQSLNLIDAIVLALIAIGLLFYSGRRSY